MARPASCSELVLTFRLFLPTSFMDISISVISRAIPSDTCELWAMLSLTSEILPEREGEVYLLRVTYDPGEKTKGRVSERLTIFVGGEVEEVLEVPVYGNIHQASKKKAPDS